MLEFLTTFPSFCTGFGKGLHFSRQEDANPKTKSAMTAPRT
jgi:hypothetical protein